jgi:hypothetical protein
MLLMLLQLPQHLLHIRPVVDESPEVTTVLSTPEHDEGLT